MTNPRWFNNRIDYNTFYSSIEELFSQFGPPYGAGDNKIIPNGFFWSSLAIMFSYKVVNTLLIQLRTNVVIKRMKSLCIAIYRMKPL